MLWLSNVVNYGQLVDVFPITYIIHAGEAKTWHSVTSFCLHTCA